MGTMNAGSSFRLLVWVEKRATGRQDQEACMDRLELQIPGMWADHHVLAVRDLLSAEEGVGPVTASARDALVRLEYDAGRTGPAQLVAILTAAGYEPGLGPQYDAPPTNKPAWATSGVRSTSTDPVDLAMSGDYRKY
jgi:copper chaperone CopZ